jgi:uncharacterized coiled-coil protein SlyX
VSEERAELLAALAHQADTIRALSETVRDRLDRIERRLVDLVDLVERTRPPRKGPPPRS